MLLRTSSGGLIFPLNRGEIVGATLQIVSDVCKRNVIIVTNFLYIAFIVSLRYRAANIFAIIQTNIVFAFPYIWIKVGIMARAATAYGSP